MSTLQPSEPRRRSPLKNAASRLPSTSLVERFGLAINERFLFYAVIGLLVLLAGVVEILRYFIPIAIHPLLTAVAATGIVVFCFRQCRASLPQAAECPSDPDPPEDPVPQEDVPLPRESDDEGDRIVAGILTQLDNRGFIPVHGLIDWTGERNIDHVLVGRAGIFVLKITSPDTPEDPLPQVRTTARWLAEQINRTTGRECIVQPVVVFPGWFLSELPTSDDAWVVNERRFVTKVRKMLPTIDNATVELIANALGGDGS